MGLIQSNPMGFLISKCSNGESTIENRIHLLVGKPIATVYHHRQSHCLRGTPLPYSQYSCISTFYFSIVICNLKVQSDDEYKMGKNIAMRFSGLLELAGHRVYR